MVHRRLRLMQRGLDVPRRLLEQAVGDERDDVVGRELEPGAGGGFDERRVHRGVLRVGVVDAFLPELRLGLQHVRLVFRRVEDLLRLLLCLQELRVRHGRLLRALVDGERDVLARLLLLRHRVAVLLRELDVAELERDGARVHASVAVQQRALELLAQLLLHGALDGAAGGGEGLHLVQRARVLHRAASRGDDDFVPSLVRGVLHHHGLDPLLRELELERRREQHAESVPGDARLVVDLERPVRARELDELEAGGARV